MRGRKHDQIRRHDSDFDRMTGEYSADTFKTNVRVRAARIEHG
jgi:hypothetical protein